MEIYDVIKFNFVIMVHAYLQLQARHGIKI